MLYPFSGQDSVVSYRVEAALPVGNSGIEYLVCEVVAHLRHQLLLHTVQALRGCVILAGRELPLKVFLMVLVVRKPYVDGN